MAALDQSYWIIGCTLGAVIGSFIGFDTTGIDFAMTALFVVIFIEQWYSYQSHLPALVGMVCGVASLVIFGAGAFILPALIASVCLLLVFKNSIKQGKIRRGVSMSSDFLTPFLVILVVAACTFLTRFLPFALFGGGKEVPALVKNLGDLLPPAVIAILVVYCLKRS